MGAQEVELGQPTVARLLSIRVVDHLPDWGMTEELQRKTAEAEAEEPLLQVGTQRLGMVALEETEQLTPSREPQSLAQEAEAVMELLLQVQVEQGEAEPEGSAEVLELLVLQTLGLVAEAPTNLAVMVAQVL